MRGNAQINMLPARANRRQHFFWRSMWCPHAWCVGELWKNPNALRGATSSCMRIFFGACDARFFSRRDACRWIKSGDDFCQSANLWRGFFGHRSGFCARFCARFFAHESAGSNATRCEIRFVKTAALTRSPHSKRLDRAADGASMDLKNARARPSLRALARSCRHD